MAAKFKKSAKVKWKWLGRWIDGHVEKVFRDSTTLTIKGKKITRHGSPEKPAYLVISAAGNSALKLESELWAPSSTEPGSGSGSGSGSGRKTPSRKRPKMFS